MSLPKTLFKLALFSLLAACNSNRQSEPETIAPTKPQEVVMAPPQSKAAPDSVIRRTLQSHDVFLDMKAISVDPKSKNTTITGIVTKDRYIWSSLHTQPPYVTEDTLETGDLTSKTSTLTLLFSDAKASGLMQGTYADIGYRDPDLMYVDIPVPSKPDSIASKYDLHNYGLHISETKAAQFPSGFSGMLDGLRLPEEKEGDWIEMKSKRTPFKLNFGK